MNDKKQLLNPGDWVRLKGNPDSPTMRIISHNDTEASVVVLEYMRSYPLASLETVDDWRQQHQQGESNC